MDQPVTAVYDANILYPAPVRDLFMRLAEVGLVRARWSDAIHDEWVRNVLADNPRLSARSGIESRGKPSAPSCRSPHGDVPGWMML
jgi:hypothetical protein